MLVKLILLLPLVGAVISGIFSKQISDKTSQILNSSLLVLSAIFATIIFYQYGLNGIGKNVHIINWMKVGNFSADWSLKIDSLSAVMLVEKLPTFIQLII